MKIFANEIKVYYCLLRKAVQRLIPRKIIGTKAQHNTFSKAVDYLDGGKVNVKGMVGSNHFVLYYRLPLDLPQVSRIYTHPDFERALQDLDSKSCMKIVVKPVH